jgi:hemerythrin-like domain-containing protein
VLVELPALLVGEWHLGDLLERHIRREEHELFPLFESHVPAVQAEEAKERIEEILAAQDA